MHTHTHTERAVEKDEGMLRGTDDEPEAKCVIMITRKENLRSQR